MGLKVVIDSLEAVSPSLREHYSRADDGKFRLTLEGGHPDTARVAEFRDTNVTLKKQVDELTTKFKDIDPDAVKSDRAKLAELEQMKPTEKITALEVQLADANRRANRAVLKDAVTNAFLKSGGRISAADYILSKAADKFAVENGVITGTVFDPSQPGVKLTVDAFITQQIAEADFAFKPSSGGGASPFKSGGGARGSAKELRNPTPKQLGESAAAIRRGDMRVVYDE